ncbi:hypothetical protein IE53DRAFT_388929 [Violaceomyces palustris]|uniref:Uncharacterized protein n=1 Tax=Violaceomyces palustris TaxID=1673888 RepID=A0ACD0NSX6_9BASI|nr:hypothetical protein IE53DRAFT_388929 [Violaceomyces palustris]
MTSLSPCLPPSLGALSLGLPLPSGRKASSRCDPLQQVGIDRRRNLAIPYLFRKKKRKGRKKGLRPREQDNDDPPPSLNPL